MEQLSKSIKICKNKFASFSKQFLLCRNLSQPRFASVLINAAEIIIGKYLKLEKS